MTTSLHPTSISGRALEHLYDSTTTTLALLSERALSTQQLTGVVIAMDPLTGETAGASGPMVVTFVTRRLSGVGSVPRTFSTDEIAWLRAATPSEVAFCAPEIDAAVLAPAPEAVAPAP